MKLQIILIFLLSAFSLFADEKAEKLLNLAGFTSQSSKNLQLNGFGSGFAVTSNGYVITASHVTNGSDVVRVIFKDGKSYDARVVKEEQALDLAVLKIEAKTPAFLSVSSRTAGLGDDIYTIGYPQPLLLGINQKFTKGSISALTGLKNDSFRYQISVPIQPGNSGGPVVSEESGEVVGIVVSSLKGKDVVGFTPQNVNYALKSGFIKPILDALEIKSLEISSSTSKHDRRQRVVQSACMIVTLKTANKGYPQTQFGKPNHPTPFPHAGQPHHPRKPEDEAGRQEDLAFFVGIDAEAETIRIQTKQGPKNLKVTEHTYLYFPGFHIGSAFDLDPVKFAAEAKGKMVRVFSRNGKVYHIEPAR